MTKNVSLTDIIRGGVGLPPLVESNTPEYQAKKASDLAKLVEECIDLLYGQVKDLEKNVFYATETAGGRISEISRKLDEVEKRNIVAFKENDVYEVKKWIERLDQRLALLESNDRVEKTSRRVNLAILLVLLNDLLLLGAWWLYG